MSDPTPTEEPGKGSPFKPDAKPAEAKPSGFGKVADAARKGRNARKRERKPRQSRAAAPKKESLAEGVTLLYGLAGSALVYTGEGPTGRAMQLQAPQAGRELDKLIRRSDLLYGLLHPFLAPGNLEALNVAALPGLVYLCDHYPALRPQLYPLLVSQLIPVLKVVAREQAKAEEELQKLTETDEGLAAMLEEVLGSIFGLQGEGSPGQAEAPEPAGAYREGTPAGDGELHPVDIGEPVYDPFAGRPDPTHVPGAPDVSE